MANPFQFHRLPEGTAQTESVDESPTARGVFGAASVMAAVAGPVLAVYAAPPDLEREAVVMIEALALLVGIVAWRTRTGKVGIILAVLISIVLFRYLLSGTLGG